MKTGQGNKIAGGNPTRGRVENDYYATHPDSTKALLEVEEITYPALEPACGEGHIAKLLDPYKTKSFDLVDRGYGNGGVDFLTNNFIGKYSTVITNPPFNLFQEFVEKALTIATHQQALAEDRERVRQALCDVYSTCNDGPPNLRESLSAVDNLTDKE